MALQMPREIVTSMLPSQANEMAVERKRSADQGAQGAQQQQVQMLQQRLAQNHEADMQTLLMKGQDADRQFQSRQPRMSGSSLRPRTPRTGSEAWRYTNSRIAGCGSGTK